MKITQDMVNEKIKTYEELSKKILAYIAIFLKMKDNDITGVIKRLYDFQSEENEFMKTLSGKDKYVFLNEMINYSNDLIELFDNSLKQKDGNSNIIEECWKKIRKDIKIINKLRRKIENKNDDDDDEFFETAAWFL